MNKIIFILIFPLFLFAKYQVVTYFPLESNLVKRIAQDEVKIREISHKYISQIQEIPNSEISKLSNAQIFFHFGLDIENYYVKLLKEKNPEIIVIDLSSNIEKIEQNPYIWMDPLLLRDIAKNIYEALVIMDKNKADFYKRNYETLLDEIDNTFLKIKQKLTNSEVNTIYVLDDYWEYFTKRFRIKTIKREKKFLNILEIPELVTFTQKKDIKKILFLDNHDYNYALSISSNLNIKMIEDNIFQDNWQTNILNLTENLLN